MDFVVTNASRRTVPGRRLRTIRTTCVSLLLAVLAAAVGLQFFFRLRETPVLTPHRPLAETLPTTLNGWTVADLPLGATEAVNVLAMKTLNFDDHVYREYRRGNEAFSIYAAYWAHGRMPTRLVASHTPDRCWTENGMRCTDARFREAYSVGSRPLLPAEYRTFVAPGTSEEIHVVYWHLVEGRIYDYGARFNAVPHPWLWWKDTLAQAAYGSREQLFVRISSRTPIAELWRQPDFITVLSTVADAGLAAARD
jgi:hypothetical protein